MSRFPTPENPAILTYPHHGGKYIPALKNQRDLIRGKNGKTIPVPNREVAKYTQYAGPQLKSQWDRQWRQNGWSSMYLSPTRICVYVLHVMRRVDEKTLPRRDGDNAYTTMQEMLMGLVLQDDAQVIDTRTAITYTKVKTQQHAKLFWWVDWEDDFTYREKNYLKFSNAFVLTGRVNEVFLSETSEAPPEVSLDIF